MTIGTEDIDSSQVNLNSQPQNPPYEKTIQHMKRLLQRNSAPMQKILDLAQNRTVLSEELESFQDSRGLRNKVAGQDQKDLILRYVLIQSNVGDLYCQKTILEEFALQYIKNNSDGNILAKVYLDFISAVDYLQSLDKQMLSNPEQGAEYLRDYNLHCLENCL